MWDTIIVRPLLNLMLVLYQIFGRETIVAVALVTLLLRLITTPLQLNQQKSMRRQQELRPQIEELQKRFKGDKQRLAEEQTKLYRESGINPIGGCLPSLIQFPIMIGLYQAIIRALASTPLQLLALPKDIYSWIPGLSNLIPLKSQFLWLDLALPDPFYVLPIVVVVTSWLYQKLLTPPPSTSASATDQQSQAMSKQMMIMMPLMTGFFTATYASGLGVYFLISNLVGILQYYLFRKQMSPVATAAAPTSRPEKPK